MEGIRKPLTPEEIEKIRREDLTQHSHDVEHAPKEKSDVPFGKIRGGRIIDPKELEQSPIKEPRVIPFDEKDIDSLIENIETKATVEEHATPFETHHSDPAHPTIQGETSFEPEHLGAGEKEEPIDLK